MKKYLPAILSLSLLIVVGLFWDNIKLPYDENNKIIGDYFYKKFNPQNELLRFTLFIVIPCFVYLISYLKINKDVYTLSPSDDYYFLKNEKINNESNYLNNYIILFVILILVEFFAIDFQRFLNIDTFHDTVFLVPPINHINSNDFFKSTLYDYGFIGNNLGLIFNKFFNFYTLGSINFLKLILILIVKFFLIFISKKIVSNLNYGKFLKIIFFIIFTFLIISLPNYYDFNSYFSVRSALYLLFIYIIGSAICDEKFKELKFLIAGAFSLISLLWWFDVGLYTNLLLILAGIYLIVHSQKKNLFFLLLGMSIIWLSFLAIMPFNEIKEFYNNLKFIILTSDYLIGLEYLKPFSENSGRWTKALLLIYTTSLILVNINFSKKIAINFKTKIFINIIFISGLINFKTALLRSDSYHLKSSSGLYTIIFIFVSLFFLFKFISGNQKINFFISNLKTSLQKKIYIYLFFIFSLIFISGINNKNDNISTINKIKNLINTKANITKLILTEDMHYLKGENLLIYEKYKILSKNDTCIQLFSDDNFFPYFLKKPTCTKFYLTNQILDGITSKTFIKELEKSSPSYILYKSPKSIILNFDNFPTVIKYIDKNYEFDEDFKGYIFYKKKQTN